MQPHSRKTAGQLQEEANRFTSRLEGVSASAWHQHQRECRARAWHHHVGVAERPLGALASVPSPRFRPVRSAAEHSINAASGGAGSPTGRVDYNHSQSRNQSQNQTHGDRTFAISFANPLQAKFLCRARLVEIDDEEMVERRRRWEVARAWTWGYETQRRLDGAQAAAEAAEQQAKQAVAGTVKAAEQQAAVGVVVKAAAEARACGGAAVGGPGAAKKTPVAIAASAAADDPSTLLGVGGRRRSPGKLGLVPGEPPSLSASAASVTSGASGERRGERRGSGSGGGSGGGGGGISRTKTAPQGAVAHGGVDPGCVVYSGGGNNVQEAKNLRPTAPFPGRSGGSGAYGAGGDGSEDEESQQRSQSARAMRDGDHEREEENRPVVDWRRDIWGQSRLHTVTTWPLVLPMPSPPTAFTDYSARFERKGEDRDDGAAASAAAISVQSGRFAGPGGGIFSGEEGRAGGMGLLDALTPFVRRQRGSGAAPGGGVGELDYYESPRSCRNLSSAANIDSGAAAAPLRTRRGGTPDHGSHHSGGGIYLHPERKQTPSETEDLEGSRSHSVSSGQGRDSLEGSFLGHEEKFDRTLALLSRSLPYGEGLLAANPKCVGVNDSIGTAHGEGVNPGEFLQARGIFQSEIERGDPRAAAVDARTGTPTRRKYAELGAGQADVAVAARTTEGLLAEQVLESVQAEADRAVVLAIALAWRFVDAYSAHLVENLEFKSIAHGDEAVEAGVGNNEAWAVPARPGEDETSNAAAPTSTSNVNTTRDWKTGTGRVERGGSRSGCDAVHAQRLLRLGMDLSNTVVLVEVTATVEPEKIKAAAVTAASRTQHLWIQGASPAVKTHPESQYPGVAAERMVASLKLWTLDVEEPRDGWGPDGPPGGVCESSAEGCASSWWAKLPSLQSFRWCVDPEDLVRGRCLPDELPIELRRLTAALRFQSFVDDFLLGQVYYRTEGIFKNV